MATTTNFGWETPDDTDLVKDGALAMRTLGNSIDSSFVDLKGGTTGQILSKASNTDLDYTWINNDQGDITEVQAGTGISVTSGTGPIPVVTNTVATAFDAKGDLIVGTGADTFSKLSVGTNNYVLTADSAAATGMKWAAAAGGGKVLQVVTATYSTPGTTSSTTFVDSGLSVSITPSATSSKVLVLATVPMAATRNTAYVGVKGALVRGSTQLSFANMIVEAAGSTLAANHTVYSVSWLDSPSTTSSTTYKIQYALVYTASGGWLADICPNSSNASIVALEIGA